MNDLRQPLLTTQKTNNYVDELDQTPLEAAYKYDNDTTNVLRRKAKNATSRVINALTPYTLGNKKHYQIPILDPLHRRFYYNKHMPQHNYEDLVNRHELQMEKPKVDKLTRRKPTTSSLHNGGKRRRNHRTRKQHKRHIRRCNKQK